MRLFIGEQKIKFLFDFICNYIFGVPQVHHWSRAKKDMGMEINIEEKLKKRFTSH